MDSGRRGHHGLRISGFSSATGVACVGAGGDVDLNQRCLRGVGRQATERAAARESTPAVLSPSLTLDRNIGSGAKVLLELVAVLAVTATVRQTTLTPGLGGELVLGGAELAGSLSLLLERLLLLRVGVADLDLQLFAVGVLDGVVVEGSDDLLACITCLEAVQWSAGA